MKQEILDFIKAQRICVLAVEMLDGSPHGATVHFAFNEKTTEFYFMTDKKYRKCEPLLTKGKTRASVVVGFNEDEMKTLQLDGEVKILDRGNEFNSCQEIYFTKFPDKKKWIDDPSSVFLSFVPKWWRFTNWNTPEGKKIILSTDK